MTQAELAVRDGIGVNTVPNPEAGRNVAFESLVRVVMVLGRLSELEALFMPKLESVYAEAGECRRYSSLRKDRESAAYKKKEVKQCLIKLLKIVC